MDRRGLLAIVALPILYAIERFAWYGPRSVVWMRAVDELGVSAEVASAAVQRGMLVSHAAVFVGAMVAAALGPRFTIVLGALVTGVGTSLLALDSPGVFSAALVIVGIGGGIVRACLFAAAAEALPDPRENARNALILGLYLVINAGSFVGTLAAPWAGQRWGYMTVFLAAGAAMGLVALLALAYGLADRFAVERPRPPPLRGGPIGGALLIAVAAVPLFASMELLYRVVRYDESTARLFSMNPVIVISVTASLAALLALAAASRLRVPTLLLAGIGMAILALGGVPVLVAPGVPLAAGVSLAAMAVGEAIAIPLLASRAVAGPHPRLAPLMYALFLIGVPLSSLSYWLPLEAEFASRVLFGVVLIGTLLAGVLLAALHRPLERIFWEAPRPNERAVESAPHVA